MENKTVEELILGSHKAFEKIFFAYYSKVKYFLSKILKSESDAEEVTQELFVRLWINRQSINIQKSFSSYMYAIARNAALNYLKHKLVEKSFIENFNEFTFREEDISNNSDEILFAKEITLLVEMALLKMPAKRRKIYKMSRDEGCSNSEIAQELGISKKTVENQLCIALKEIRQVVSALFIFFI